MKKAMIVSDMEDVELLNQELKRGWDIERVDNFVYILSDGELISYDDEPKASANNSDESPEKHLSPFKKLKNIKGTFSELDDEPKIKNPYAKNKSKRGLGDIAINVKVEVDDSELKQLGEKYSKIGKVITEAVADGK